MRRVDGEGYILGTKLVEPKQVPLRTEDGEEVGRVSESGCRKREQQSLRWRLSRRLAHQSLKNRLKRPDARVGVRWKGCRKQLPKASFSAAFSQVQRLMRLGSA
jgi:hypothetical protein